MENKSRGDFRAMIFFPPAFVSGKTIISLYVLQRQNMIYGQFFKSVFIVVLMKGATLTAR